MVKPWFLPDGISAFRRRTVTGLDGVVRKSLDICQNGLWQNKKISAYLEVKECIKYFAEIELKEELEVVEIVPPLSEEQKRLARLAEEASLARHRRVTEAPGSYSCYAPGGAWRYENE